MTYKEHFDKIHKEIEEWEKPIIKKKKSMGLKSKLVLVKIAYKLYQMYNIIEELGMGFLKSKKFMALLVGVISLVLVNILGFPEEQARDITDAITILLSSFMIGQGVADGLSKGATSGVANSIK